MTASKGVVIRGGVDEVIESRAARAGLGVATAADGLGLPFEKNLIVEAKTRVPWDLLPAAWHFLEPWDAAVPLWRYGVLAADVGTVEERGYTNVIVRDLRVLLHSVELLFVRRNEAGVALVGAWHDECQQGADRRLAFLRALYRVKPRVCVLPTTWLAEVQQWRPTEERRRPAPRPLEIVEVAPGVHVKRRAGDDGTVAFVERKREVEMAVLSEKSFVLENQKTRSNKGPLVRVQVGGRWVKMYEADAVAQGLVMAAGEPKARPAQEDKARPATNDKGGETAVAPVAASAEAEVDDFTTIDGVGRATARRLVAQGIVTFAQLRQADLGFLSSLQQQVIRDWIEANHG